MDVASTRQQSSAWATLCPGQPLIQLAFDALPLLLDSDGVTHVSLDIRAGITLTQTNQPQYKLHTLLRTGSSSHVNTFHEGLRTAGQPCPTVARDVLAIDVVSPRGIVLQLAQQVATGRRR